MSTLQLSDKYLSTGGRKVSTKPEDLPIIYELCVSLQETMNELGGIGLSACQVGKPYQLFVTASPQGFYLNCQYLSENQQIRKITEGCLSLPGKKYLVPRYTSISLQKR